MIFRPVGVLIGFMVLLGACSGSLKNNTAENNTSRPIDFKLEFDSLQLIYQYGIVRHQNANKKSDTTMVIPWEKLKSKFSSCDVFSPASLVHYTINKEIHKDTLVVDYQSKNPKTSIQSYALYYARQQLVRVEIERSIKGLVVNTSEQLIYFPGKEVQIFTHGNLMGGKTIDNEYTIEFVVNTNLTNR